jgi:Domain of unknown function (DUF4249)
MKLPARTFRYFLFVFLMMFSCRKAYDPPAIRGDNHFLSVDGFIYTGNAVASTIILSRSVNLDESGQKIPELHAEVIIQSSTGEAYHLIDSGDNGIYQSSLLNLDSSRQYRLAINTSDANKFQSDFVSSLRAPPIDSLSWELISDPITLQQAVNIYVNAHDPTNATRYYRWDFLQTYKHFSTYSTAWADSAGLVYPLAPADDMHPCWSTVLSQNIALGTSITLSQDVISHLQIASFEQNDPTLDVGSSFLVRQYPLTEEGYTYWLNIQKNSQSLGGLFDLQPAQLTGNLHCLTNPSIPVLGYISASTIQEGRIYISNNSLPGWQSQHIDSNTACQTIALPTDPLNTLVYNYPDTAYGPYFFASGILIIAPKRCLDCRYQGGVNVKPSFWPAYD